MMKSALFALALMAATAATPAVASITTLVAPPGYGATDIFLTVFSGEPITIDFASPQQWFGFYWIDAQPLNWVTFHGLQDTQYNSQGAGIDWYTSRFVEFSFTDPGTANYFTSVTFSTNSDPFYFGNVSTVPEPSTWALMLLGFAFIAIIINRKRPTAPTTGGNHVDYAS